MDICKQYDDLSFVLAHGRPFDEAKNVLKECPNVYVDTAFMPADHVKDLADAGYSKRILFGTDAPINLLYNIDVSTADYIRNNMAKLRNILSPEQYEIIFSNKLYT